MVIAILSASQPPEDPLEHLEKNETQAQSKVLISRAFDETLKNPTPDNLEKLSEATRSVALFSDLNISPINELKMSWFGRSLSNLLDKLERDLQGLLLSDPIAAPIKDLYGAETLEISGFITKSSLETIFLKLKSGDSNGGSDFMDSIIDELSNIFCFLNHSRHLLALINAGIKDEGISLTRFLFIIIKAYELAIKNELDYGPISKTITKFFVTVGRLFFKYYTVHFSSPLDFFSALMDSEQFATYMKSMYTSFFVGEVSNFRGQIQILSNVWLLIPLSDEIKRLGPNEGQLLADNFKNVTCIPLFLNVMIAENELKNKPLISIDVCGETFRIFYMIISTMQEEKPVSESFYAEISGGSQSLKWFTFYSSKKSYVDPAEKISSSDGCTVSCLYERV